MMQSGKINFTVFCNFLVIFASQIEKMTYPAQDKFN
jgi:hypothetical protein